MLSKTKLKQGTLAWEKARSSRIGSSEIFDIVKYYATDDELQNCGINAEAFRDEKPYTTTWALYHKLLNDGFYKKEDLAPEFAEYGHAIEPYGVRQLQKGRNKKLKPGEVYANDVLIASLDISGTAEEVDLIPFSNGVGTPKLGEKFVCEQKSMMPQMIKNGMPFKYILQAQYQIMETGADFYILQIMVLKEDTVFIRGKVCQMSKKKRYEYLDDNMDISLYYFKNNPYIARLIEVCLERFFEDVRTFNEPTPYIENDKQSNIIESIRLNVLYNDKYIHNFDLSGYISAKENEGAASNIRQMEMQKIIEAAKEFSACRFKSDNGVTAAFGKDGSFRIKFPEVIKCN